MTPLESQRLVLPPDDEHNRALVDNVHPPGWTNPEPSGRYHLVVIGAGTAGLVTAAIAAAIGAKVALVEKHLMGGDCLNVGCVPSKGLIRASRAWMDVRGAGAFGVGVPEDMRYDFGAAMERMRRLRARISHTDSAQRFTALGVDVFVGEGRFTGPDTLDVEGRTLAFRRAAICTGARAAAPGIDGLGEAGYLTNETVFSLTELPRRVAVIGAGPVGCELAQAFAGFGAQVSVLSRTSRILPRDDPDAAGIVQRRMTRDGVTFLFGSDPARVERNGNDRIVHYRVDGDPHALAVDEILVAAGRAPNVRGLGLESAGVEYDLQAGVKVDRWLRTANPRIYAAGDICFPLKFTHTADAMAQIVVQNALFPHPFGVGRASVDGLIIPWCTFTSPEVAHVGWSAADARTQGIEVETYTTDMREVDRAVLDGDDEGFARVHVRKGTDRIVGATIVGAHAGDLISEVTAVMRAGKGLGTIAATIHPYPTQAEVIRKVANAWRKARFSGRQQRALRKWFGWTR